MKNRITILVITVLFVSILPGCKKEGPPGPAGKDGNANVKSTTHTFSNWYWNSSYAYDYADFTWGEITSDIVNSGSVFVYLSDGIGGWIPLPRTVFPSSSYSQSQRYVYYQGGFSIIVQDSDLTQPGNPGTWTIKVLSVAGSVRTANPDLDWNNYEAVKTALNLSE